MTIYFPSSEDKDRAQAAFAARGGMEGYISALEWMADVIVERTAQRSGRMSRTTGSRAVTC